MSSTIMKSLRSAPGKVTDNGLKATVMTLEPDAAEGLHNFAPLGTMTSSSPMMAQPSEVMLQATSPGHTSRNLGTDPANRNSPLTFGQLDGVSSDSIVDVLYQLGTTQDPGTKDRIHSLLQWVREVSKGSYSVEGHSPSTSRASTSSSLGEYGILEPSPSHIQCVAAILWHSYELPVDYDLPALLDRELFALLYNWSISLPCNVVMKKAVDSLLCSMCHINPNYFSLLMSRMGIVVLGCQAQHHRPSKKKQPDANITNDLEHARLLIDLSQSQLATLAAASQSPEASKQLLDSGFPSLLVRSLYQLCCGLLASAELPLPAVATSQVEARSQPLLPTKLAVPMLCFLTEVGNSHAIKDWLGGPEVRQLWSAFLSLLCHSSASPGANACVSGAQAMKPQPLGSCSSFASVCPASGLTTQQRTTLENTTVAFFRQCISCHPTNQRLMAQLLCELYQPASQRGNVSKSGNIFGFMRHLFLQLYQPASQPGNVPKSGNISGFMRHLFLQLMLDEEKVTVCVQSSCPLYQGCKDQNGTSHVIQHPKYGAGRKYRTLHLPISTTLAEVLYQVSGTPSITAPMINEKSDELKNLNKCRRKKKKDKEKMKADSGFQDSYSAVVASGLKSQSKHVLSTPQQGQFTKKQSVCQMTSSSGMDPTAKPTSVPVFHLYHELLPGHPLPVELTLAQLLTVLYNRKLPLGYLDLTFKLGHEPTKPVDEGPDTAMDESLLEASPIESQLQVFASVAANMLPFQLLQALFSSTPLTTEDGLLLRRTALEVGAVDLILSRLSAVSHHSPHFPSARADASPTTEKQQLYWAKGTGFNSGSTASVWDMEKALAKQRQEEEHVSCLLQVLASYINPAGSAGGHGGQGHRMNGSSAAWPSMLREVLGQSCLIPVMSSYLRNDSVMDMAFHVPLYRALLELLRAISTCAALAPLLLTLSVEEGCSEGQTSMSMLLAKMTDCIDMYTNCLSSSKQADKQKYATYAAACGTQQGKSRGAVKTTGSDAEPDDLTLLVSDIQRTAKMVYAVTASLRQANQDMKQVESSNEVSFQPKPLSVLHTLEKYVAATKKLQFDTFDMASEDDDGKMVFHVNYHYKPQVTGNNTNANHASSAARARRLAQEAVTLSTSLPLSSSSSVFVRCDDERLDIMKVLITGPPDTPYANGCFEFDVHFPQDYPNSPPQVTLKTTGGQSVRFNPNLYDNGYVCLSILNTWSGRPEERWNPQTSTLLQVLVSLQSLILVPEPYFNEPGYEGMRGTPQGTNSSHQYTANIRQATVKWAMLEQLRNPSPCFKEVIHRHFYLKRAEIVAQCGEWIRDGGTAALKGHTAQLRDKLLKLCCPEGLESNEEFSDVIQCQPKVLVALNKNSIPVESLPSSPKPRKKHKKYYV